MLARPAITAALPGLAAAATATLLALSGCGSGGTRTVSVSDSQSASGSVSGGAATTSSHSATAGTSGRSGATGPAPTGTTQAPGGGPAFAAPGDSSGALSNAESVLAGRGFQTLDASSYHSAQTLRVLIGARRGSADAHVQQAFFFVGARFLGTDTSDPSAHISVITQSDTAVTLAYSLYRSGDPLCCASGGQATVTYQLDNGRLRPLNSIPDATPSASPGRE